MSDYRQEPIVRASFVITEADLAPTRVRARWLWYFSILVAMMVATTLSFTAPPRAAWLAVALFLVGAGALLWSTFRRMQLKHVDREIEIELDESTFSLRDDQSWIRVAWDALVHWEERDAHFVVCTSLLGGYLIPKRVLQTPGALVTTRQLLERAPRASPTTIRASYLRQSLPALVYLVLLALLAGSVLEAAARAAG